MTTAESAVIYCPKKLARAKTKKPCVAIPILMLAEIDLLAQEESRTRSDLVRESLRQYMENAKKNKLRLTKRR